MNNTSFPHFLTLSAHASGLERVTLWDNVVGDHDVATPAQWAEAVSRLQAIAPATGWVNRHVDIH